MASLYGNELNEYYVSRIRENFEKRAARLKKITTKEQAERYVAGVRRKMQRIFQFPERTPLNAEVTAKHTFDGFTVENILFYSRPNYPVTANLYLPESFSGKLPGVLFLCGHSRLGKGEPVYRSCAIGLVLKGFAVLSVDPVEQGERLQYRLPQKNMPGVCNHNLMGNRLALCGEWFGSWRTWDAVRGLDYLASRPEVDPAKLSVTGNSGGGTLTTWVAAADPRPKAVAPSCYVTSWKHNIENELPADIEQMPPRAFEFGLEMGDFLLAQAPRDILILGQKNDYFDPRGVVETFHEVERINSLLGGKTQYFIGPCDHGYYQENREAMYRFFTGKYFGKANAPEPKFTLPPLESSFVLPEGHLENLPTNKFQRAFTRDIGNELAKKRKKLSAPQLRDALADVLKIKLPVAVPHYRVLRTIYMSSNIFRNRFGLETEPGRIMSVLACHDKRMLFHPDLEAKKITLYVPSLDSCDELGQRLPDDGSLLYAVDPRGIGEMMPSGTDQPIPRDFFSPYQFDYHYAALGTMFGEPMIGGRVRDILAAAELLTSQGAELTLEANGLGCIPALMAAVLSSKISRLRLGEMPESYDAMLDETWSKFPLSCMAPGILRFMDLPDLKAAVRKKLI